MKTFSARAETTTHDWYVVDAADKTLGRLASQLALRLRGKHKAIFTPHVDTGDYFVVVNVDKLRVTGKSRDELQAAMRLLKQSATDRPIGFNNFRD